jgi:hypothetical protein
MWNLNCFSLETVLVWVQDWCRVCAKRTIGSEIVLDKAQVKARFGQFGDSANLDPR